MPLLHATHQERGAKQAGGFLGPNRYTVFSSLSTLTEENNFHPEKATDSIEETGEELEATDSSQQNSLLGSRSQGGIEEARLVRTGSIWRLLLLALWIGFLARPDGLPGPRSYLSQWGVGEAANPGPPTGLDNPDMSDGDWHQEEDNWACEACDGFAQVAPDDDDIVGQMWSDSNQIEPCDPLVPSWVGDLGFDPDHLEMWAGVVSEAGISRPKPSTTGPKRKRVVDAVVCPEDPAVKFVETKAYQGRWSGWTFGTNELGTGYRKEVTTADIASAARPITLCLDTAIPEHTCTCSLLKGSQADADYTCKSRNRRARRARHPDGSRKNFPSRRKRAAPFFTSARTPDDMCEPTCLISDKGWAAQGLWAIDTVNGNCWSTLATTALARSRADIIIGQETKRDTKAGVDSAKATARQLGWNAHLSRAHPTAAANGSGGGAVMVRRGCGLTPPEDQIVREPFRHRIALAWCDAVVRGGVHIVSVYLRHSEGLSQENMAILDELSAVLLQLKGPWIVGGDWNLLPAILAESKWTSIAGGVIFAMVVDGC